MSEMFKIKLPDGSVREMPHGSTPADVAAAIGPGLAKAALAARIDGEVRDITRPFEGDSELALITSKDEKDALELVRHDFAHVLAEAVQRLYPGTQITFGPATEDGFYYDRLHCDGTAVPIRIRSLVGLIPLLTVDVIEDRILDRLPNFRKRMEWFVRYRSDMLEGISYMERACPEQSGNGLRLLAVPTRERLERAGCVVHEIDGFEMSFKGLGGPTCLTRPIWRER